VVEWLRCLALKLLPPLRWGSNPMRGSCQLLTQGFWFTPMNHLFLQLWKLTAIYNQIRLKNSIKHSSSSSYNDENVNLLKMYKFGEKLKSNN